MVAPPVATSPSAAPAVGCYICSRGYARVTVVVAPAAGALGAVAVVEAPHLLDVQRGQLTVAHAGHARVPRHDGLLPVGGEAWSR